MKIDIILRSIECLTQSEKNEDELYCLVDLVNVPEAKRFPEGKPGYWVFKKGQKDKPELSLFSNTVNGAVEVGLDFREDDTGGLHTTPFLGDLMTKVADNMQHNEFGKLVIAVTDKGDITWKTGSYAMEEGKNTAEEKTFSLNGAKAEYMVTIAVKKG